MTDATSTIEISDRAKLPVAPLVSVHMLAYRHENFVAQAIESVVAQQCDFPFELIIAEDCSPDRTREIVLDYQRRYPHLIRVLVSDTNVGMQANLARCSAATRGKFGAACEGDDFWCDPTKLARQIAVFDRYPGCVVVFHPARTIDENTGHEGVTGKRSPYSRFVRAEEVVLGDGGFIPSASIMVKQVLGDGPTPPWVANAAVPDYAIQMWAACVGRVAYIDRIMSAYRVNVPGSWSSRHALDLHYRIEHARNVERMFDGFLDTCGARYRDAAARMVSKYYSDALVRVAAGRREKQELYKEAVGKMLGSDRWLAWLAARCGIELPGVKTSIRKTRSLARLAYSLLTTQRIRDI